MNLVRKCTKCNLTKDISQFFKRKDSINGYRSHCNSCLKVRNRLYKDENRTRLNKRSQELRCSPQRQIETMLWTARNRAKKKGREFNITKEDIVIPQYCPILGLKLTKEMGKATDNSMSLDRIDSSKGYIKGNVQVVSRRANILKNNATLEEIKMLYSWLLTNNISQHNKGE